MSIQVTSAKKNDFNPRTFLSSIGKGREMVSLGKKSTIFAQASVITSKAAIHDQFKTGHTLEDVHDIGCSIPPPAGVASLF